MTDLNLITKKEDKLLNRTVVLTLLWGLAALGAFVLPSPWNTLMIAVFILAILYKIYTLVKFYILTTKEEQYLDELFKS